jgi:hypothetical protein
MVDGIELFERAAAAHAVLLAAQRLPGAAGADREQVGAAFLLTFDAGRILLSAQPETDGLHALQIENDEDLPSGLVDAQEEEPWWRVLGSPLARASAEDTGGCLRLQLREDADSPRTIEIVLRGESLRASLGTAAS